MLAELKEKIWGILHDQEVSLVMIVGSDGEILWRRGRSVAGRTIGEGEGFSKTALLKLDKMKEPEIEENAFVQFSGGTLSQSARGLRIRTVLVVPLSGGFSLYIDSGTREGFTRQDISLFRALGDLLSGHLERIHQSQGMPGGIVGDSEAMTKVRKLVMRYAIEEDPVLLSGETGVGKNHVAELIHQYSGRKGRLVTINTPSIPDTLMESELFGCRKGAYSGAVESRKGLVAEAEGGTLFLDEIAEIPLNVQAKLLAFIERKTYRPIGESREIKADVRIITASNRILSEEVGAGRFRRDLYYRLNILPIVIPPLRHRREDIDALVTAYTGLLRGAVLDETCRFMLRNHDWPGNVRELIQVMKRCGVLSSDLTPLEALREILVESGDPPPDGGPGTDATDDHYADGFMTGNTFWQGPWRDFIERRINTIQLRTFLMSRFRKFGSLKTLAESMNIPKEEYPRFVSALHKYDIHPAKRD